MSTTTGTRPRQSIDAWLAALLLVLLPVRALSLVGSGSANVGLALAVVFSPVLVAAAWKYEERRLVGLLAASIAVSPILATLTTGPGSGRFLDVAQAASAVVFLANGLAQLLAILYARLHMSDRKVAFFFGVGALIHAATTPDQWADNPWKFAFAWPVTVLVLALVRSRGLTVVALIALAAVTIRADSRSFLVFLVATLVLVVWRSRAGRKREETPRRRIAVLVLIAALAFGTYQAATWLSINGYLGARNQAVSQLQEAGGGVLTNGRPEWHATLSLAEDNPFGYGPGVRPDLEESSAARVELRKSVISEQYIDDYVFADAIELHSVTSDLWFRFGLLGLASAVMIGVLLVRHLIAFVVGSKPSALHVFVVLAASWDLLFSPIGSNLSHVLFAVGLLATVRLQPVHDLTDRLDGDPLGVDVVDESLKDRGRRVV